MENMITTFAFVVDKTKELYNIEELQLNRVYNIKELNLKTKGLNGHVDILSVIRKQDKTAEVFFTDESYLRCAKKHILIDKQLNEVYVCDLSVDDELANEKVVKDIIFHNDLIEDFYDIGLDSEDMIYESANGILHHNTYTVEKVLGESGLEDGEGYFKNTGTVSPIGLFMLLYKYRDEIILFDDSDNVWSDQEGRNILKAATDTKKSRKLVWNKKSSLLVDPEEIGEGDEDSIPKYFFFTGKIIFISNLQISKLDPDGAMRTRSLILNVDPTDNELLEYMEDNIMEYELEDGLVLNKAQRLLVMDEIKTSKNKNALSLRRLVRALNIRAACEDGEDWKRLVKLYA